MSRPCRFCGAPVDLGLVDLGRTPLANSYLAPTPEALAAERSFPLAAMVCTGCWLVQLGHDAPAAEIFAHDYAYLSSYSESWVAHARRYAEAMTGRLGLGAGSLVLEVASNDGYLLQHFAAGGVPVLGIEPAGHAASLAEAKGVPTRVMFFDAESARRLAAECVAADLIAANNVLAHVPDIRGFAAGFPHVLKREGVVTFEFPHLLRLLAEVQFDTIYHEHYSYLSLAAVERVLGSAGLAVFEVEELPTHGGSLRVFAGHRAAGREAGPGVGKVRADEAAAGIETEAPYRAFAPKVARLVAAFRGFLDEAAGRGLRVAGYGAAAKGNTFLNVAGVGVERIFAVADRNPQKQGRLLPGSHIPIVAPDALIAARPDLVVILPWNLRAEIAESLAAIRAHGGRFAVVAPGEASGVEIF